ncbi:MAG: hypothetical protein PHD82_14310, partial [Candidatus Riflebacteria bacterium]|nr:hypothetical protein [Candidatus Riflebacteria bacterium]
FKSWSYTTKAEKVAKAQKTVRYHVVITDKCSSDFSQNLIESIKEAVNCKIFVLTRNLGVMLKDAAEREKIPLMEGRVCYLAKRSRLGARALISFLERCLVMSA